jgi:hypothetical protein
MRYLHSIVRPNTDWAASSTIGPFDLPVNPLSLVMLNLEITNANPSAIGVYNAVDQIMDNVSSVIIKHKGENIIQGSLRDLVMVNALLNSRWYGWDRLAKTSAGIRRLTFPLAFGRRQYDPDECFPATTRGNLTIEATRGANGAAFSDINFTIEAVELIEANPKRYVKYTTLSSTAVVGLFDQALPIGNPFVGLLLFDTAIATLDTATSSWGQVKLLKDNIEQYYPLSDFQTLAGMVNMQTRELIVSPGHRHQGDGAQAGVFLVDPAEEPVSIGNRGYAFLDFDPLRDDRYLMDTTGAADIKLRGNGTSATAVRTLPIELVTVKQAA